MPKLMSDMPVPENCRPWLVNAAGDYTRHTYSHTEEVPWVDENGQPDGGHLVAVFTCERTGAAKRCGSFEEV